MFTRRVCMGFCALGVLSASASATISTGLYQLHNHPDGSARPPLYGLRLDELYDVTGDHDIFTFDFDHASSSMWMSYTGTTIHIWGLAWGGRDTGGTYAADGYQGIYTIDFLYDLGVQLEPGDDDVIVDPPSGSYNYGTMLTPLGDIVSLRDGHYSGPQRDFRFGDEDNDLGHRGHAGLSGWGWMFHALPGHSYYPYVENSDWLFTATLVPTPGALALVGMGGVLMTRRRR